MSTEAHSFPRFSQADAERIAREVYGLRAAVRPLPSYEDQNFHLVAEADGEWVLKISNASAPRELLEAQVAALEHLGERGGLDGLPRVRETSAGEALAEVEGDRGARHLVHLLSYLPGTVLAEAGPRTPQLLRGVGVLVARVDRDLGGFDRPILHRTYEWDLKQVAGLRTHLGLMPEPRRALLGDTIERFARLVTPRLGELPTGVIHNDGNDYNVLVRGGRAWGMLDFGDLIHTPTAFGLAIAAAYALLGTDDPLAAAAHVAAGYHAVVRLREAEVEILFPALCARLATSVIFAERQRRSKGDDPYLEVSSGPAGEELEKLGGIDPELAARAFRRACGMERRSAAVPGLDSAAILAARRKHLSRSFSVSFRRPLQIVRGSMQYLYDETGRAYLDGVDNVVHVGHCHPRVVAAGQRQMALLNTNTRFLHAELARYVERLAATFPEPLDVCFMVCTGSEANDLALRLARAHTGRRDAIVVDGAYHGTVSSVIDLSSYKFDGPGGSGAPPWVHKVPMPDPYRRRLAGDPQAGETLAGHVGAAAAASTESGGGVAAFYCESLLGCGGQIVLPAGYLEHAYRHVRAAGGVCVADEVQVGFGRVGSHMWGFELQGVVPDIVTLGKPIGNGHPMAAVITTREIAGSFLNGMEYFNTFAGNPVSCAIGNAVLDVIEEEGLQAHALAVGERFRAGLEELAEHHPLIGDVRGTGLFLGVELVRDRELLTPAAEEASEIVERLKRRGIILSTDGPLRNVLKIKPPMVFSEHNAEEVVVGLDAVLGELS